MNKKLRFPKGVKATRNFVKRWMKLTEQQRKQASKAIARLVADHRYPSLKAHPIKRCPGKYECAISVTDRIVYARVENLYILYTVGGHEVIDSAHVHCSEETDFSDE